MGIHEKINHRQEVSELAQIITNRATQNKPILAVDVSGYGIDRPFTDAEYNTIYRSSLYELSNDTMIEEQDCTHYPNAEYGSIFDY